MSTVWVVILEKRIGRNDVRRDRKLVRASTREGAVRTAKANSFMSGVRNASYSVRPANPVRDLGCVPYGAR